VIGGCFKNFFAMIGCLSLLLLAIVLAWLFWPQIRELYESRISHVVEHQPVTADEYAFANLLDTVGPAGDSSADRFGVTLHGWC
jgi:hypothetical protein